MTRASHRGARLGRRAVSAHRGAGVAATSGTRRPRRDGTWVGWGSRPMQRPSLPLLSILAGLGLGLAACSDPPPPDEVRARISSDLAGVLTESQAALEGGTEALPGGAATAALDRMLGTSSEISTRI